MNPGGICQITTEDGSTNYTYSQMQQMQTAAGNSGLVAVGVMSPSSTWLPVRSST
jgi:hypothetical protein